MDHDALMAEALQLAENAVGLSDPNPRVGCVMTSPDGRVIGRGHTQQAGGPHAEVMAIRDAQAQGESLVGATAHVTLEPCAHTGRTPPCCNALIAAGVSRVVMAIEDPFEQVAGRGAGALRAAGVEVISGVQTEAAYELNIGFFSRVTRGRPWVRLKVATSLDGYTALPSGTSQWITGEAARTDGHAWRRRSGAILTGVGTVRSDNPRMDVRLVGTALQPLRVIVDSRLESPPAARIFDEPGKVLVCAAQADPLRELALRQRGAEIEFAARPGGEVDLARLLDLLGHRGVNELHVEAGHRLNGALLREGLVDELLVYVAPKLLGAGLGMAQLHSLSKLADATQLRFMSATPVGDDIRIIARIVRGTQQAS
jgi:diaminohydroxyphosphoribosylaminopyrimidine deaminase/5-amino-6-(5-phosphoribosylamino)uracil reductase